MKQKEVKICQNCKKPMEYRKKWRNNWDEVKFCSERCRRNKKAISKTNAKAKNTL